MIKTILFLLAFGLTFIGINPAFAGNLNSKIKLQDAVSVSQKANTTQVHNSSLLTNPLYNSLTNGTGNFMQGMMDNPSNVNSMREQNRQKLEYLTQPASNSVQNDDEE